MGRTRFDRIVVNRTVKALIVMLAGGLIAIALPKDGILDGSTRIIPFFALLMAGVIPAMMQTVTVLKGDNISPQAVQKYGDALESQLKFWAALIVTSLLAIGSLTLAVILNYLPKLLIMPYNYYIDRDFIVEIFIFIFGIFAASVISRFVLAYGGLRSILRLNVSLAKQKSVAGLTNIINNLKAEE
jgi:hypothetical protein